MKIGVDVLSLTSNRTGIGNYVYNILIKILSQNHYDDFYLFSRARLEEFSSFKNVKMIVPNIGIKLIKYPVWLRYLAFFYCKKYKLDVFWGPNQILPRFLPRKCIKLVTVHDMSFKEFPETISLETSLDLKLNFKSSLNSSDAIFCVSEFTINELKKYYGIENKRLVLNHSGINKEEFYPVSKIVCEELLAGCYNIKAEFILSISTIEPRKNLITLVKAFNMLVNKNSNLKLVLVGRKGWKNNELDRYIIDNKLEESIVFTGYVPDEHLKYFYSTCKFFIAPSIYEGFGLPNIEALACGAQLIVSDIPVFREILEDKAIYFEKYDYKQLVELINNATDRKQRPSDNCDYTWNNTAGVISEVLENIRNDQCIKAV